MEDTRSCGNCLKYDTCEIRGRVSRSFRAVRPSFSNLEWPELEQIILEFLGQNCKVHIWSMEEPELGTYLVPAQATKAPSDAT